MARLQMEVKELKLAEPEAEEVQTEGMPVQPHE